MADNVMLTTIDNPYNPFTHFDQWFQFDESSGYHSNSLLARTISSSDELSDQDQDLALERAIDDIVKLNLSGIHTKIYRNSK